jgi:Domain of unknown function (DUF1887)
MKRMMCFISGQLLPNFIPINEVKTRPEIIHAVYTPSNPQMKKNFESFKKVVNNDFPEIKFSELHIKSEYDAVSLKDQCEKLLKDFAKDEWSLNSTGGTKLMSSPVMEFFLNNYLPVYYVETPKKRTLLIKPNWETENIPFESEINISTYFNLHGIDVITGTSQNEHELKVFKELTKLNWKVWQSVKWKSKVNNQVLNEFDFICIENYQMSAFECKNLNITKEAVSRGSVHPQALKNAQITMSDDLYKLAQVRNSFGGPFGKSYWIFDGRTEINQNFQDKIQEFNITLIRDMQEISRNPSKYKLPNKK